MNGTRNDAGIKMDLSTPVDRSHHHNHQPSNSRKIESVVRNKSLRSVKSANVVQVVSTKDAKLIDEQSIEEDERRLDVEGEILRKAIRFETQRGYPPSRLDLLCLGISNEQISIIYEDLRYLYPDFDEKTRVPELVMA